MPAWKGRYAATIWSSTARFKGAADCAALLEIQPKGRIIGDVCYKVLEMHGGAQVLGKLTHHDSSGAEPLLVVSGA